jgi:hypothetical protein
MSEAKGGSLSPVVSRVRVSVSKGGVTTYLDRDGIPTILELIDIEIVWGVKLGDRWTGTLVKEPEVLAILEKIKKKTSSQSAKVYAASLPRLSFLDYRYGSCEKMIEVEPQVRYPCGAAIIYPGLDGYKCFKCGWVLKTDLSAVTSNGKKQQRRKEKQVEQIQPDQLSASQLDLFRLDDAIRQDPVDAVEVWAVRTDEDTEAANQELMQAYADD